LQSFSEFLHFIGEKYEKSQYLLSGMTDFDIGWRDDGEHVCKVMKCKAAKNFNIENPGSRTATILKSKKSRIGRPPYGISEIKFLNADALENPFCTHVPNFAEIGHPVTKISRFVAIGIFLVKCTNSLDSHA